MAVAFLSLFTKQKKALQIITLVCAFMVLSSCVPSHIMWNDLNNYEVNFNSLVEFYPIKLANDWAYYNSMYICKLLGMSYMEAKSVLLLISLILILIAVGKFTQRGVGFVFLFFMLHLIFNQALILRNSIGFSVLLLGIDGLIKPETKHGGWRFVLFTILGAQFHSMIYLYLPLIVVTWKWENLKKYRKLLTAALIFGVLGLIASIRDNELVSIMATFIGNLIGSEKYIHYAVALGRYAWLSVLLIWGATVINAWYVGRWVKGDISISSKSIRIIDGLLINTEKSVTINKWLERMQLILLLCSVYIPLAILTLHQSRFLKYMTIVNFIYMAMMYEYTPDRNKRRYIFLSTLMLTLLWLYFDMNIYGGYSTEILTYYVVNGRWFWE
nr:EpsG family protein [Roseburia zhanii]